MASWEKFQLSLPQRNTAMGKGVTSILVVLRAWCHRQGRVNHAHKLVFNEELRLAATLHRQPQTKNSSTFQKKSVVFNLITVNGQILARAVLDLAQYATLDSSVVRAATLPLTTGKKGVAGDGGIPTLFLSISCSNKSLIDDVDQDLKDASSDGASSRGLNATNRNKEIKISPNLADQTRPGIAVERKCANAQVLPVTSAVAAAASAYASKQSMMFRDEFNSSGSSSVDSYSDPINPATEEDFLTPRYLGAHSPAITSFNPPLSSPSGASPQKDPSSDDRHVYPHKEEEKISRSLTKPGQNFQADATTRKWDRDGQEGQEGRSVGTEEVSIVQAASTKFANEKLEHKALDAVKLKFIVAEAKAAAADDRVKQLESRTQNLEGELADVAAVEVSLYSVVAQHGSSPHKVHRPARRMARLYIHACKSWSQDRRASCARSCVSGLVLVARACGNDVTRLSFWLSNVVVLREMISQAFEISPASPVSPILNVEKSNKSASVLSKSISNAKSSITERMHGSQEALSGHGGTGNNKIPVGPSIDWRERNTFVVALEHVEGWIFGRIIESVWWQALTPPMQKSAELRLRTSYIEDGLDKQKSSEVQKAAQGFLGQDFGVIHQGNLCLELWKSAFLDVLQRICPVRAGGHECGCLRFLTKMILEQCVSRLDVAMFNAILRDPGEWAPTDPIADPIVDPSVLPIRAERLSFGGGAQLKIAIRTWSTWLAAFTVGDGSINDNITSSHLNSTEGTEKETRKQPASFPLLTTMADLLMLPKDMLMDKSVRREVCPTLSLPLIKKILENFVPDDFSPDPVSPSLLTAITAEIAIEKQMHGEVNPSSASPTIVPAPRVHYAPPSSGYVRELIGDTTSHFRLDRSSSSLLKKAHTSDDELEELESPLSFIMDSAPSRPECSDINKMIQNGGLLMNGASDEAMKEPKMETGFVKRFQLLKEVWYSH
ncbi:hypothetical protein O6H91_Y450400 [Diphasiastrum complanatum]|nr:hypothetical protein O6H91_Y450400 [Diphasiastrum complanatum]